MTFSVAEARFLAANADAISAVEPEIALTKSSVFADRAVLDQHFGDYARAVSALIAARRAAAGKFPALWLTDADAAQQATPARVAGVRAARIAEAGAQMVHDVTCSVGSEAPAFRQRGIAWMGSDLDMPRLIMARHNLGQEAWLAQADALTPVTSDGVIVADPARRAGGRRITDPAQLLPPLPDLLDAQAGREMAVKCAPGIDYSGWDGLVSVVSVDGGVKEACLYTPGLAGGVRREAVVLREVEERVTDLDDDTVETTAPQRYIIDPDGAVVRAGLVRGWAARHELSMLDEHIAYLTGEQIPAGYSGFPFLEAVPLRALKKVLASHGAGSVEILVRGVDVDPDQLRKKLKLRGKAQMAVVIARIGDQAVAHVCEPRVHA